jgi:hypothetical protein
MMSGEAWLYLLAVLINAVNLFLQVFFTIMYSDLEWCVFLFSSLLPAPSLPKSTKTGTQSDNAGVNKKWWIVANAAVL